MHDTGPRFPHSERPHTPPPRRDDKDKSRASASAPVTLQPGPGYKISPRAPSTAHRRLLILLIPALGPALFCARALRASCARAPSARPTPPFLMTHDAATGYFGEVEGSYGKVQDSGFEQQLECGVRGFDLRTVWYPDEDRAYTHIFLVASIRTVTFLPQTSGSTTRSISSSTLPISIPARAHNPLPFLLRHGLENSRPRRTANGDSARSNVIIRLSLRRTRSATF